ncbi:GvpL/GvpF family gas vesicle protein [Leptolyngbya sp. FACHB-711]|uniref:gas vesicle protein GvpF n=1 Tax=unclassified Leptolyngbya TaxID=2650499 RepID=UPI00168772AA|nr:GvpL/GvpF family gas vesicle protein [Leptolyngbya sp. FACHB-711]MBD1851669.1 GvpL/GvpF family gas vesicle protein [Cyanobacteria bacterium FACHB-502]MBD2023463.1 GvpL/GvpF family gas vesicle protein [Leptolyngbya sp. FACHB-711]
MSHGLYLYGIFPSPGPKDLGLEGLDKQPVQAQVVDEFVFLYSEAQQERYLASRRNLLGHERVLEQAMEQGYQTLLPLQFGLIIQDWERVQQQLLVPKGEVLKQLLHKLEGRREVSVKVVWDAARELEALMQENAILRDQRDQLEGKSLSMDEVVRIGQAIERAMNDRKQAIVETFRQRLNGRALETVENDSLMEGMIYNAAYLIPWEQEAEFCEQVEVLDQAFENRLRIRYNSFTAPFNFAQLR